MRRALLFAFVLASTTLAAAPTAHAQNDVALAEAQARFKEGLDFADGGNHEAARLKFQQAWAVFKSPAVLYNLARSEQLTGHDIDAFEHFKEFLKTGPDPKVTDAQRKKAQDNVAELAGKIGQIDLEVAPNARVTVDGKAAPDAAREPIAVPPGRHVVEATLDGRIKSVTVECTVGTTTKAKIEFEAASATTPVTEPPPAASDERPNPARYVVPAAIGVAGLAALGVGIGFAVASQNAKDEEDTLRTQGVCFDRASSACQTLEDKRSDVDTKATISTVGYVSGGVLLAAAAVTYFVWPSSSKKTGSRVVVSPTASGAMLQLGGRF